MALASARQVESLLTTRLIINLVDRRGRTIDQVISKEWRTEFRNLWDAVRAINAMRQRILIHSFDQLPPGGTSAAASWPVANLAMYVPFTIYEKVTIRRILTPTIITPGNIDIGIYRSNATRIVSSGSVASMENSVCQALNIAPTILEPGRYFFGMAVDNNTFQTVGYSFAGGYNRLWDVYEQTSGFPLPANADFREHISRAVVPSIALDIGGGQISISYVGASANIGAASGNLTITPPTTATNDIMICAVATADNVALTFPANWTIYQEGNNTAGLRSTLAWKRSVGAEAAFTITHTAGGNIVGNVAVYRGCAATGSPINASSLRHNGVADVTADSITPDVPNCLIVLTGHVAASRSSSDQVATDPATLAERFDSGATIGGASVSGADGYNRAGGATGNGTITLSITTLNSGGMTALTPLEV